MLQELPIGLQDFRKIRENNFFYLDKTRYMADLAKGAGVYFLARPRRFGKSLMLSTLKEMFSGSKELFGGLWLENNWDWGKKHPVVHIGFDDIGYATGGLVHSIERSLREHAKKLGVGLEETDYDQMFKELIQKVSAKHGPVVILIDEYDKPIIDYLDKEDLHIAYKHRAILKIFYSVLKGSDPFLRFVMITGVSKFSRAGIFSELNNLRDLTLNRQFSTMLGYTEEELRDHFQDRIGPIMEYYGYDEDKAWAEAKNWYNGYSWDGLNRVYNPYSILLLFAEAAYRNFWFESGSPSFLIKLLKERNMLDLDDIEVNETSFSSYDLEYLDTHTLLLQTGYLTIKAIKELNMLQLCYPNKEVRESMFSYLIAAYRHYDAGTTAPLIIHLRDAFRNGDPAKIVALFNTLFATIPSHIFIANREAYYHSLIYLSFKFLGVMMEAEVSTSKGRIDAVVETPAKVWLLEFKLDKTAKEAIDQIKTMDYAARYRSPGREVVAFGINFSSEMKEVEGWEVEVL